MCDLARLRGDFGNLVSVFRDAMWRVEGRGCGLWGKGRGEVHVSCLSFLGVRMLERQEFAGEFIL